MCLIILYGLIAFALDLVLFAHIGTQAALAFLEIVAALGAMAVCPFPFMLVAGFALSNDESAHPIKEVRSVAGAYVPLVLLSVFVWAAGGAACGLASLWGSGVFALAFYVIASCLFGCAWLLVSARILTRTHAENGTSRWWQAKVSAFWRRRVSKKAAAITACILACALSFSLFGIPYAAYAEGLPEENAAPPAEPDIYVPTVNTEAPASDAGEADASSPSTAPQTGSTDTAETAGAEDASEAPESDETPQMPALPPVEYYEQPDVEGEPVAIEGDTTLMRLSERKYTTIIGGANVAFEDAAGTVQKIDNELEPVGTDEDGNPSLYRNKRNAFTAELPASTPADEQGAEEKGAEAPAGLTLKAAGYVVQLLPQNVDFSRACAEGEAIRYTEARSGIDWQYTLVGSVVKEDIVLAYPVEEQSFETQLVLPMGLDARMDSGVCVVSKADDPQDEVMRIAAPIATDAAGEVSADLSLELTERGGSHILALIPDWEWLASSDRAYPVRIDPAVDLAPSSVRLGCVEQQWRNLVVGENGYAYAGYDDGVKTGTGAFNHGLGHAICRAYAETNYDFSYIMSEARIDSATFSLYQHRAYSGGATNLGLYRVMEPWNFDRLTWASQESLTHELVCFRQANTTPGYIDWDVRECVNNWVQGVWEQRGFCIKAEYERGMQCEMFQNRYAANPPRLTVDWTIPDPVDESRSLDDITVKLRTLTEHDADNKLALDGVFADGEATPRSTVAYTLDPAGETGIGYASRSYKYPDSSEWQDSIPNATRYKDKLSNWQSHVFSSLAYDTLYKVRAVAMKDGVTGKEGVSDTFLVYKASAKDTLPYIASHYGTTLDQLARDNRVQDCLVVGGNTIFVRNPKTNTPYNPANLTEDQKRRIDSGLMGRGKHCEYGFEPVNMNTGNFVLEGIDATIPDLEDDFEVRRTYNSKASTESGALGRGWSMSFTDRLSAEASGALVYTASDGASYWFDPDGAGGYVLDGDAGYELTRIAYKPDGASPTSPDLYRYELTRKDGSILAFDRYGMLTSVTSSAGLVTAVEYDANHLMSRVVSPSGASYAFEHDGYGRISAILRPDGLRVVYGYDAAGNLTQVTEAGGGIIQYFYDGQGRMTEWRDPTGAAMVRNAYDGQGRVTSQLDANGNRSVLAYSDGCTHATDAAGSITTYRYDDLFRTTSITYPDGYTVSRAYDGQGNLISDETGTYSYDAHGCLASATDLRGQATTYVNDEAGHVLEMTRPDGVVVAYAYDGAGKCTSETWSTGASFTRVYDELHRLVSETDADGATTVYGYAGANLASETDALGNTTSYAYDAMGRCVSVTDPLGRTERTSYDAMGRVIAEVDGSGASTRYVLDARGLLLALTDANGQVTAFAYDAAANLVSMTDASGGTWEYGYDALGNCISETDPLGNTTRKTYDGRGRVSSQTDATGVTESWEYDGQGRIVAHTLPSGAQETFSYEGSLQEASREIDALGNVTTRSFDAMGNVTSVTHPDGGAETYSYVADELSAVVSPGGLVTSFERTPAGKIVCVDASGRAWGYSYDAAGNVVTVADPAGHVSHIENDAAGQVTSVTDADGRTTQFTYDGAGRMASVTDALGNTASYSYDSLGNPLSQTDAAGNTRSLTYTATGLLSTVTDPLGNVTSYTYDAAGNQTVQTDARGGTQIDVHDGVGRVVSTTDAIGRETLYSYDAAGNLVRITLPDGSTEDFAYDAAGRVIAAEDASGITANLELDWRGNVVRAYGDGLGEESYAYDAEGRLASFTDAAGRTASVLYDLWGSELVQTDVDGAVVINAYDERGQLISETDGIGATTRYAYDASGNVVSVTDAQGGITEYAYDAAGRMVAVTDALGHGVSYQLDALGNIIAQTDEDGFVTHAVYDAAGRMVEHSDGVGATTKATYDASGNVVAVEDANGSVDSYIYDLADQLIAHTDARGGEETFSYDVRGNMVQHTSAGGAAQTYQYDASGNLIKETDAEGATTTYDVNALGLATRVTAPNGSEYAYRYDAVGRMIQASSPLGYVRSFAYGTADSPLEEKDNCGLSIAYELDGAGRITKAVSSGAAEAWDYDSLGNLIEHTSKAGTRDAFSYDAMGRLSSYTDGAGIAESYAYDGRGNLTSVKTGSLVTRFAYDGTSNVISEAAGSANPTRYAYDKAGQLASVTDGAGAKETYSYDEAGNLTGVEDAKGNRVGYAYDADNNLTKVTSPLGAVATYAYDGVGRLNAATDADGGTTTYARDASGNITSITDATGQSTAYAYDTEGNITSATSASGATEAFAYDMRGYLTSLTLPSGATTRYDYDELGQLLSKAYSAGSEDTATYTYDADGRVASRTDACGTAVYAYDGAGRLISETDGFGQTLAYAYDDSGALSSITYPDGSQVFYAYDDAGRISSVTSGDGVYAYAYDDAGHPALLTRPDGVRTRTSYDEVGNAVMVEHVSADGNALSRFAYTYDAEGRIASEDSVVTGNDGESHISHRTFSYTDAGKLATVSAEEDGASYAERYEYDGAGNRTRLVREGASSDVISYAYDADDRLIREESVQNGTIEYAYDADGQLTSKTGAGEELSYSYGVEGRLEAVRSGDLLLMSAVYDGDGKKVAETTLYHASRTLPEAAAAGTPLGSLAIALAGGDGGAARICAEGMSYAIYAMAALTGGCAAFANPAAIPETMPRACKLARDLFSFGAAYVPKGLPSLVASGLEGDEADALARSLGVAAPALSVTDELYDVTAFANSTLFEEEQVAYAASSRSGASASIFGLARLAEAREGATTSLLEDARGSVAQESSGASVLAWRRYSAFGAVTAGTDAQEKAFYGYNGEAQSSVTGLVYLRFRHYDPTSAHFGVQDTYLGNTFNPASLNRYLFCESDPINNIDPSGHITLKQRYELDKKQYGKTITNSRAYQLKQKRKQFSRAAARWVNGWLGQVTERLYTAAGRPVPSVKARSSAGRRTDWAGAAQRLQRQYRELYCGLGRPYLSNDARTAQNHLTFDVLGFIIPVIPDAVNALIYTAEGDKEEASFSAVFALTSLGGPIGKGAAKGIHIGSGIVKGSAKATEKAALKRAGKIEQNRLHHIFADPKHKLDGLITKYGSEESAFHAIEEGALRYANENGVETANKWTRIEIDGEEVDATWRTVDGVLNLVDASRREVS